jgi:hypothetical protein
MMKSNRRQFGAFQYAQGRQREMKELPPRYTLRVSQILLDKLGYIADFEGRTKNKELEQMIKKRVHAFEAQYGEIPV